MRRFTKVLSSLLSALMVLNLIVALPAKASESILTASEQDIEIQNMNLYNTKTIKNYALIAKTEKKPTNVPVVEYAKTPTIEYKAGDIVKFDLYAPNYKGRVQYRVILWDGNKKKARDLWTTGDRYYKNWMPYGSTVFNLHWKIDEPGLYRITVYVKRAGIKNSSTALSKYNCDSYIESQPFVVKERTTAFDKDGQTYGSSDQNKAEIYNNDISLSGKNVIFNNAELNGNLLITGDNAVIKNVKVSGKVVINPGRDGSCTLDNVAAKNIQVLSGGCNSIHIKNSKAETMNIESKNNVRVEVDGDTEITSVLVNGYVILDKKSGTFKTITITESENGESVVEFRGDIQDKIEIEGAASIKTAQASRIANLVVNTKSSTDKVKLEGNYDRVEVNSIAKLELKENTKLKSLVANKDTEVTMDKTAVITDVEKNNNNVVIIKEGGSEENTEPKGNGDGYKPPAVLVNNITVTSDGNIDTVINGKTLQMNTVILPANAENKTIVWTVSPGTGKATINASGLLTAVETGSVTVKAVNPDSGVTGTKLINIIDDPALIAEYTNAVSVEAVKALLDNNQLKLDLTNYAKLSLDGKLIVAKALYNTKASLVSKKLIQDAVTSAMPVFITRVSGVNGVYNDGVSINISVNFSENVTVNGTPAIQLDICGNIRDANYLGGSGTSTLIFCYTVQSGDNTPDLEYKGIDALNLNGGEIKSAGNTKTMILALPAPSSSDSLSGTSNIVIDTIHPSSITISTPNEILAGGGVILSTDGGPLDDASWIDILNEIKANTGLGKNWITGVQSSSLSIVPNGNSAVLKNNSSAAAVIEADFIIPKTKIYDRARNYSDTDIVINSYIMSKVKEVNSSAADGYYKAGDTILINIVFDEAVDVIGMPKLCLETGTTDRLASFVSGSETNTLTFNYTVQPGDTSQVLDYTSENALILNGGMIKVKGTDINANLTLPRPGTGSSLGYIKNIKIDAIKPASIAISSKNIIHAGEYITLTSIDGPLDYNPWMSIYDLIKCNISSNGNWITGISPNDINMTLSTDGMYINLTNISTNDAIINRDFIIPKDQVVDIAGNTADNDIRIDSCNTVTDIAKVDEHVVLEINNVTPDLFVAYAKTVGQLKSAIKAVDDSPQTYVVTDSTGTLKEDNSIILSGDVLVVTSEGGLSKKSFPIRVAPEPITTIQLKEAAVNASSITIDNTKGSEKYMVIGLTNMTVGQVKSGLKSTNEDAMQSIQTYEIVDNFGNIMTDEQIVCTGSQLIVTAYDGVTKASYVISVDLSIIKIEDISVNEGDSGTVAAVFTIKRIGPTSSPLTIGYQFDYYDSLGKDSPYNASYSVDYTCEKSEDIVFNANESTKTFIVKICGDTVHEENEKFQVILSYNYLGADIRPKATCTIIDNDI